MPYTIEYLFGKKESVGSFDDFCDKKYTYPQARAANDFVVVDFVRDEEGVLFLQVYHIQKPEHKLYSRLQIQRPFAGIDVFDEQEAIRLAMSLFL